MFLPGKPHGQGAWWATVHGVEESDRTEQLKQQGKFMFSVPCLGVTGVALPSGLGAGRDWLRSHGGYGLEVHPVQFSLVQSLSPV